MKRNERKAFNALQKMGVPVYDRGEGNAAFTVSTEDYYDFGGNQVRAGDCYRDEVREYCDLNGNIINMWGIQQHIHDILNANGLYTEWWNGGMFGVYPR